MRSSSCTWSTSVVEASATCWTSSECAPTTFSLKVSFTQELTHFCGTVVVDQCTVFLVFFK
eukprot:9569012-Prorocentrum_lima.AAC.1